MNGLQFLKLGGSLITHKEKPHTARPEVIRRLAEEISQAFCDIPTLQLVLGHGSGSFGHVPADKYKTRQGVHTPEEWQGFVQVWREASALNRLVVDALAEAGVPAITISPSASLEASAGQVSGWENQPLQAALASGLLPVIHGDVVFDTKQGGTILSTEDLFAALAGRLHPTRILLAGLEPGVWADFPACTHLLEHITPEDLATLSPALQGSGVVDVTGGMASKVALSLELVNQEPGLEIRIFSGLQPGAVYRALHGEPMGTVLRSGS